MKRFLRPNVMIEPLVAQWYAWPHLIPPATAARNITERHLRIMDSYLSNPDAHATAVRNPKLLGGPFMDFDGDRTASVMQLRDQTVARCANLFTLSDAIAKLDELLRSRATGYSLQELYQQVPEPLKGYVELVYDRNNCASFRLLESLLYRSPYYDPSLQSVMLSEISGDSRPFVLSTPRLENSDSVHLTTPFDHEGLEMLNAMRRRAGDPREAAELLGVTRADQKRFDAYFTSEPPVPYEPYTGPGARWRYFGHACILLETRGTSILIDPVLSYTYESDISRYTYQDLPDVIDFAIVTHNHQDHVLFETLMQLRDRIRTLVVPRCGGGSLEDPSLRLLLQHCGFRRVIEMDEMEELSISGGSIQAIPFFGEHGDLNVRSKSAYLVRLDGHSILFAADSCNISADLYRHVHDIVGDVEVLFLGMECDGAPMSWLYGPLFTKPLPRAMDQSRRLAGSNCAQAIDIVERFNCQEVYVYAMGQEPWLNYVMSIKYTAQSNPIVQSDRLLAVCRERGIVAERLFGEKQLFLAASENRERLATTPEYVS
jgi:L-ascorbate metabolism protein UlaG (beta-lactamase superfamily)